MEEALGYQSLIEEYGLTQEEAAARVGKSRPAVANALRLLNLPESVLELLRSGSISAAVRTDFRVARLKTIQAQIVFIFHCVHLLYSELQIQILFGRVWERMVPRFLFGCHGYFASRQAEQTGSRLFGGKKRVNGLRRDFVAGHKPCAARRIKTGCAGSDASACTA